MKTIILAMTMTFGMFFLGATLHSCSSDKTSELKDAIEVQFGEMSNGFETGSGRIFYELKLDKQSYVLELKNTTERILGMFPNQIKTSQPINGKLFDSFIWESTSFKVTEEVSTDTIETVARIYLIKK